MCKRREDGRSEDHIVADDPDEEEADPLVEKLDVALKDKKVKPLRLAIEALEEAKPSSPRLADAKKELKIEICSVCHPFYTGNQKFVDAAGRVDRFKRKFAKKGQK